MTRLTVAQFLPQSPIIVTGGNPHSGKTDADAAGLPVESNYLGGQGQWHSECSVLGGVDDFTVARDAITPFVDVG